MTAPKPRRRSIRFAIVAVVCLLLGAVTTVGVAWKICQAPPEIREAGGSFDGWPWTIPPEWGWPQPRADAAVQYWYRASSLGRRTLCLVWRDEASPFTRRVMSGDLVGWPWCAFISVRNSGHIGELEREWRFVSVRQGFSRYTGSWSADPQMPEWMPVLPLFPGFALDTAVYAAAWYVVMFTPLPLMRAGRRRFRVSRGMCGSCGYDLKGSKGGPCPECGRAG